MKPLKNKKITATIFLILALAIAFVSAKSFLRMHEKELIIPGSGVTEVKMLSDYFPKLKGTNGDTEVYILEGEEAGSSLLILGGTHPNEPSGYVSAISIIEKAKVRKGKVFVIPRANNSAFTHNDAQEGSPQGFYLDTGIGKRFFRYGSRATNPIDQWPDPDVYIHAASGQKLSGSETRNLNRGYPGRPDGTLTEQICYGITQLIKTEDIDITIDLHEASPEYPVINAIVAHERAMPIASMAAINLQLKGIQISLEPSPTNLRGLTHRELGDYTDTLAILMETANPAQGRLRGKTDEKLVTTGIDPTYEKAAKLGRLYVPFDETGHPLEERVGRHVTSILEIINAYNGTNPDRSIVIEGMPSFDEIMSKGFSTLLNPPD